MKSLQRLGFGGIALGVIVASAFADLTGAIFTTDSEGTPVNQNIYTSRLDVYLNGGPAAGGNPNKPPAGLPDGEYYCQVTEPNGDVLGTSVGSADETPIVVVNGVFAENYQLWAILIQPDLSAGYALTSNPGGEYKVWVSTELSAQFH